MAASPRLSDLQTRATEMEADYLQCRVDGHNWKRNPPIRIANGEIESVRECRTCEAERIDIYDGYTFELLRRWYNLPDGYAITGMGQIVGKERCELRSVSFRRELGEL